MQVLIFCSKKVDTWFFFAVDSDYKPESFVCISVAVNEFIFCAIFSSPFSRIVVVLRRQPERNADRKNIETRRPNRGRANRTFSEFFIRHRNRRGINWIYIQCQRLFSTFFLSVFFFISASPTKQSTGGSTISRVHVNVILVRFHCCRTTFFLYPMLAFIHRIHLTFGFDQICILNVLVCKNLRIFILFCSVFFYELSFAVAENKSNKSARRGRVRQRELKSTQNILFYLIYLNTNHPSLVRQSRFRAGIQSLAQTMRLRLLLLLLLMRLLLLLVNFFFVRKWAHITLHFFAFWPKSHITS